MQCHAATSCLAQIATANLTKQSLCKTISEYERNKEPYLQARPFIYFYAVKAPRSAAVHHAQPACVVSNQGYLGVAGW